MLQRLGTSPTLRPDAGRRLAKELRARRVGALARHFPDGVKDPGFAELLAQIDGGPPSSSQRLLPFFDGNEAMTAMLKEKLGYLGGKIDGQTIHIETHLCGQIEVLLNDDLVDLDKPITIVVDGTVRFEGTAKRKLRTLLDIAKDDWEFQRLFPVRFEVGRKGKAVQR